MGIRYRPEDILKRKILVIATVIALVGFVYVFI